MQKSEFAKKVRDTMGEGAVSQAKTEEVITATFELIAKAMEERDKISIPGFGSFESVLAAERTGKNPRTGEPIPIPARFRAKFKPSSLLAQRVAG